jgi:hypothetical protein
MAFGWGLLATGVVQADAGPPPLRPTNPTWIDVRVTRHGEPTRGAWKVVLLVPASRSGGNKGEPTIATEGAAWLTEHALLDASGQTWKVSPGGERDLEEGGVRFHFLGRRRPRPPGKDRADAPFPTLFRLAVYDPATQKLYVTDPAETRQQNANYFRADLREDGGGSLELLPQYWPRVIVTLGLPLILALALTLATELAIAAPWVAIFRPGGERRYARVLLTTVVANLFTVPALFVLGVLVKTYVPENLVAVYLAVLIGGPALAIGGQALLYLTWGRMPRRQGILLSLVANLCSVVFCFGGVWAYGW